MLISCGRTAVDGRVSYPSATADRRRRGA